jgi:hypothetical protein
VRIRTFLISYENNQKRQDKVLCTYLASENPDMKLLHFEVLKSAKSTAKIQKFHV